MATTMMRRQRTATPARWQKALTRALDNGIEAFRIAGTGAFVVTSATKLDTVYRTDGDRCECEAALGCDPVCQHRAVVRFILGWLPEPSPPTPAAPALIPCRDCRGEGSQRMQTGGGLADWWAVPCRACNSTGTVPGEEAAAIAA